MAKPRPSQAVRDQEARAKQQAAITRSVLSRRPWCACCGKEPASFVEQIPAGICGDIKSSLYGPVWYLVPICRWCRRSGKVAEIKLPGGDPLSNDRLLNVTVTRAGTMQPSAKKHHGHVCRFIT